MQPSDLTTVLNDGLKVGQDLARMEIIGERIDHRHSRAIGHLVQPRLRRGAPDDSRNHALKHARGVGNGLFAAELRVDRVNDERLPTEIGDSNGERHPGASGGLVEDDRSGLRTSQWRRRPTIGFECCGQGEHLALFSRAEVVVAQEVADHEASQLVGESMSLRDAGICWHHFGARAALSENLEQNRMRDAAIDDGSLGNAAVNRIQTRRHFRDHARL